MRLSETLHKTLFAIIDGGGCIRYEKGEWIFQKNRPVLIETDNGRSAISSTDVLKLETIGFLMQAKDDQGKTPNKRRRIVTDDGRKYFYDT